MIPFQRKITLNTILNEEGKLFISLCHLKRCRIYDPVGYNTYTPWTMQYGTFKIDVNDVPRIFEFFELLNEAGRISLGVLLQRLSMRKNNCLTCALHTKESECSDTEEEQEEEEEEEEDDEHEEEEEEEEDDEKQTQGKKDIVSKDVLYNPFTYESVVLDI
jgi:hypothetical protein